MTDRLADETAEEREARLQQTTASNHARLATETTDSERERPGCSKGLLPTMRDWRLRLLRREMPGYSLTD